jgi:hypothetical protein
LTCGSQAKGAEMQEHLKDIWKWAIQGLVGFFLVSALQFMRNTEAGLKDLSIKLAVIVEKVSTQDKMIEYHERRLQQLEVKNGSERK